MIIVTIKRYNQRITSQNIVDTCIRLFVIFIQSFSIELSIFGKSGETGVQFN